MTETEMKRKKDLKDMRHDLHRLAIQQIICDMERTIEVQLHNISLFEDYSPGIEEALEGCSEPIRALREAVIRSISDNEHGICMQWEALVGAKPEDGDEAEIWWARKNRIDQARNTACCDLRYLYARASWIRDAEGMLEGLQYNAPKSCTPEEYEELKAISERLKTISHNMFERGDGEWVVLDRKLDEASLDDPREADPCQAEH